MTIYTIGHSNLKIEDFINLLKTYKIKTLVDVRSMPGSNYVPAYNQENLIISLKKNNIELIYMPILGGRRKSTNKDDFDLVSGWKNVSFRNYASYTLTKSFEDGLDELIKLSKNTTTAIMCAENVPWKCHRSIIANNLAIKNIKVIHILSETKTVTHSLNLYGAIPQLLNGKIIYPL